MDLSRQGKNALIPLVIWLIFSCNIPGPVPSVTPASMPTLSPAVPTATSTPSSSSGSIHGVLWHDTCQFTGGEAGEPVVLGQGCVQWGSESWQFAPNQTYDNYETGWAGVTLHLGAGVCPSTGLEIAVTSSAGEYRFDNLAAGTYCVSYSALTDGNESILIPGGPTYPAYGEGGYAQTGTIGPGEDKEINFGYAWQFYN